MKYSISTFTDLPLPVKAALLIASGASLGTVVLIIPSGARWIILIGLVVLVLLLLLYWYLLQWRKKRKVIPMERDLMKNTSAAPPVSGGDPKVVALLDDLRKKFERGIETFRANGKSLYDFPWYMVVGEPGSGKTEAVRHSNVGFPPGLQDTLQGAGGTLNMNWWFTDHAVILDTAGRMMFEQAELGGGHDWKEFLNLLKKSRRHCPINGVLLVIPADSLIRDTTDEIEQKANKIAQQFDVIQRTLNVRFPVFVVITKSDLINGFRDFFDNITDPKLQHQILGWSNPLPIDEPYRPDFIDQHVKMIKGRLFRRRLALMQQIICGESGVKEKRLADILYTFPQSLTSIAPRLARYLELIFRTGNKWSGKPLFFRGIYFTSSMREGSALDAELAETLGVPAESLPDGRVWEHDRAYFLRDLLLKKVFPEQGLVTNAKDAKKQHFLRKTTILGTIAASLILLIIYTFLASNSYENRIGTLSDCLDRFIEDQKKDPNESELLVVQCDSNHPNNYRIAEDAAEENLSGKLANAIENFKGQWMFVPINWFKNITDKQLRDAAAIIYNTTVLEPFLRATCNVMTVHTATKEDNWSHKDGPNDPAELRALHRLIRIKADKPLSEAERSNFIDDLFNYIKQYGTTIDEVMSREFYAKHKSELHEPLTLKLEHEIFNADWRPALIMEDDPNSLDKAIENGIGLFNEYWQKSVAVQGIKDLKDAIEEFNDTETQMLGLIRGPDYAESRRLTGVERLQYFPDKWTDSFEKLKKARETITGHPAYSNDSSSLVVLCEETLQDVNGSYKFLLNELDLNSVKEDKFLDGIHEKLEDSLGKITKELERCREYLDQLENKFWASFNGRRLCEIRFDMYSKVNERINADRKSDFDAIRKIENADKEARNALGKYPKGSGPASLSEASELCTSILDLDKQLRLLSVLQAAPNDLERIKELVERNSDWDWTRITNVEANKKFDPNGAANVINSWKYLVGEIDSKFKEKTYDDKNNAFAEYSEDYLNYWLHTVPLEWINSNIPNEKTWKDQSEKLSKLDLRNVFISLEKFGTRVEEALVIIDDKISKNEERKNFNKNLKDITSSYKDDCQNMLDKWAKLSDNVFVARRTLLEQTPRDLISQYFPSSGTYRPKSPSEFVYMYWTSLTLNSLKKLADDTVATSKQHIEYLKRYEDKFPLQWDGNDLNPEDVKEAYSLLEEIPLRENYGEGTIGRGAETNYAELNNLLEGLSKPSVPNKKKIERIRQVLQGLPKDRNPYYCKISFVAPSPVEFTRRFEIEQNGVKSGRKGIDTAISDEKVCTVEYGTYKPIYIKFYQFEDSNDVVRLNSFPGQIGPFEGRWAILRILHDYPDPGRDIEGYIRLPFKDRNVKENSIVTREIRLKLDFFHDEECEKPITGFVHAIVPKD